MCFIQKGIWIMKTPVYKAIKITILMICALFSVFWSYVVGSAIIYQTSSIGVSGLNYFVNYFDRFTVSLSLYLLYTLMLLASGILLVFVTFKKQTKPTLNSILIVFLFINSLVLYLIPPQVYAISLYVFCICTLRIPDTVLSRISFMFSGSTFLIISVISIVIIAFSIQKATRLYRSAD